MTRSALILALAISAGLCTNAATAAKRPRHTPYLPDPYYARTCESKVDAKPSELKREIKCDGGIGAGWRGEWKEEFRDGRCLVTVEATREVYKKEIKCDG
jgi:hypothetical protein